MRKSFFAVTILILIFISLIFSSCSGSDARNAEAMTATTGMLDKIVENDIEAAYGYMNSKFISINEFRTLAEYISDLMDGCTTYGIEQIGWYRYFGREFGGESYDTYSATFTVTVSKTTSFTMEVVFVDGKDGICGIDFADTSYVDSQEKELSGLNVILIIYSWACFIFTVVMFIHCVRSNALKKVRLVLLTLIGGYIRFTLTSTGMKFSLMVTLLNASSSIAGDLANNAVVVTVGMPIGAIIYFICRKKFKQKELPPPPQDYDPRANSDGFKENSWL